MRNPLAAHSNDDPAHPIFAEFIIAPHSYHERAITVSVAHSVSIPLFTPLREHSATATAPCSGNPALSFRKYPTGGPKPALIPIPPESHASRFVGINRAGEVSSVLSSNSPPSLRLNPHCRTPSRNTLHPGILQIVALTGSHYAQSVADAPEALGIFIHPFRPLALACHK